MPSKVNIDPETIKKTFVECKSWTKTSSKLGVSVDTIRRIRKESGLSEFKLETPKDINDEQLPWPDVKKVLQGFKIQHAGQNNVHVSMENCDKICLALMSDWHVGSDTTDYNRLISDIEIVRDNPTVFCGISADMIDNFTKTGHGGGIYSQVIPVPKQRAYVRNALEQISDKTLWVLQGSHEEFSFNEDGFDFAKYCSKHIKGYYLGFQGTITLDWPSGVSYTIYACHAPPSRSRTNPAHGLRLVYEEREDFDIGVSAHYHSASISSYRIRGRNIVLATCGSYKTPDRFPLKNNLTSRNDDVTMPGIVLDGKEKKMLPFLDFREALDYV